MTQSQAEGMLPETVEREVKETWIKPKTNSSTIIRLFRQQAGQMETSGQSFQH